MNLFDLFVRIGVKDEASGKLGQISNSLGKRLKAAAKVGVAAVSAAASGIAALTTAAVKNYAEYEQLVGGVDTLFKESSERVQQYAANAFQTAGVSANTYMSTVTSFSASLLQSLGNDTQAAADLADQALRDMSDNANKMGTDMQIIINTYQSLARGNYAMLDNLKLGFGGTKAEMERLIETAAKLDSSVKSNDMSFGNLVQAIHVVQTEMGITGTTALEAATTIQGSVNSMKAAWQNLLTGIADENADFEQLVSNFVDTAGIAAENILPRITIALQGVARLITTMLPPIFEQLPMIINDILPQIVQAAIGVIEAFVSGVSSNSEEILTTAVDAIMMFVEGILGVLPQIIDLGIQLIIALIEGLAEAMPELIPMAVEAVITIWQALLQNLPLLISAGIQLIGGLLQGLLQAIPQVIQWAFEQPKFVADAIISGAPGLLDAGKQLVANLEEGFKNAWSGFVSWVNSAIASVVSAVQSAISAVQSALQSANNAVGDFLANNGETTSGLQAGQARGKTATGITNNYYINNPKQSAADMVRETKYTQNRTVMVN